MEETSVHKGPLAGLRVVELAHVMAGPVGGLMLADMGAQVIKVEKLPGGDDTRRTTPPAINGESASFMILTALKLMSSKFPIGVGTKYRMPFVSSLLKLFCCHISTTRFFLEKRRVPANRRQA